MHGKVAGLHGNGQKLGLPKELDFSSDENEDFLLLDGDDQEEVKKNYVGFKMQFKSEKVVLGQADDAFNNLWQGSTKREKQLIIEPARQTTHECAVNQPAQQNSNVMNARLPHMMESILTNMQSNMKPT